MLDELKTAFSAAQSAYDAAIQNAVIVERDHAQQMTEYERELMRLEAKYAPSIQATEASNKALNAARDQYAAAAVALADFSEVARDTVSGVVGLRLDPLTVWRMNDFVKATTYLAMHHPALVKLAANATIGKALSKVDAEVLDAAGIARVQSWTPVIDRAVAMQVARQLLAAKDAHAGAPAEVPAEVNKGG